MISKIGTFAFEIHQPQHFLFTLLYPQKQTSSQPDIDLKKPIKYHI